MTANQALTFFLFAVVAAVTPGPSNVIITSTGASVGLLRGLPAVAGVAIGMGLMIFLVALGLGNVVLASPVIIPLLRWSGAIVLLWLAWQIATARHSDDAVARRPVGFWGGAAFQWINPKSWLVSVSAIGTYLHPASAVFAQALGFGLLFILAALPCAFVWLAFGASLQRLLRPPRTAHIFNIIMGLLLASAVLLFVI